MARRQKEIIMPHLNDCCGDLTKKWYVEYSIRNPQSGKMERIRTYDGINQFSTYQGRYNFAQKLIKQYSEQIKAGDISYQEFVEYNDMLLYDGEGSFTRKRKAKAGNIKIYLSDFLQIKKLEVNKKSFETYRSKLRLFCMYAEKSDLINKPATYYTNEIITDFLRDLVNRKNLSRKSIEKYEQILHSFFKYLNKKKVITENPVTDIPKIGVIKDEAPAAIPAYMRNMLKKEIEIRDPQLWMFICFIYYMAIRPGKELRLIRLNQIDYDTKKIIIPNYVSKNSNTEAVDIPDQLFELIVEKWQLHTYNQELYVFGKYFEPGEKYLSVNNMSKRFNQFRDKLKLPISIKLYSWKHSGAQELAAQGASIYEIQRHLRHRDLTTTEMYLKKRIGQRSNMIKHNFPSI
ncbi:MAG: site-specific integrase [Tannerella sp.]|jgi:integrase|nr:site-specific integrase [Tannerella sp.]